MTDNAIILRYDHREEDESDFQMFDIVSMSPKRWIAYEDHALSVQTSGFVINCPGGWLTHYINGDESFIEVYSSVVL